MENFIRNIIANSKDSKILRRDIFRYFEDNQDVTFMQIRRALSNLKADNVIISKLVPGENYDVTEYSLSESFKETMLHI